MLGKDPDVAEDFTGKNKIADIKHATHTKCPFPANLNKKSSPGTAITTEKVLRARQRDEICGALRNSSVFYHLYVGKSLVTVRN